MPELSRHPIWFPSPVLSLPTGHYPPQNERLVVPPVPRSFTRQWFRLVYIRPGGTQCQAENRVQLRRRPRAIMAFHHPGHYLVCWAPRFPLPAPATASYTFSFPFYSYSLCWRGLH